MNLDQFSMSSIIAATIFGSIGFVAFIYGKKMGNFRAMALGIALSVYPFFVQVTLWVIVIGIVLTAALYFWRD